MYLYKIFKKKIKDEIKKEIEEEQQAELMRLDLIAEEQRIIEKEKERIAISKIVDDTLVLTKQEYESGYESIQNLDEKANKYMVFISLIQLSSIALYTAVLGIKKEMFGLDIVNFAYVFQILLVLLAIILCLNFYCFLKCLQVLRIVVAARVEGGLQLIGGFMEDDADADADADADYHVIFRYRVIEFYTNAINYNFEVHQGKMKHLQYIAFTSISSFILLIAIVIMILYLVL